MMPNSRYNLSLPHPHWEASPSISTYYAADSPLMDSYFRLHRRRAARRHRVYRASLLAPPPDTYPAPVCLLAACPPFLVELCHRKHGKLVLAVSFNLLILNDQNVLTLPPVMMYETGMDTVQKRRVTNHLKKMHAHGLPMSDGFKQLATYACPHYCLAHPVLSGSPRSPWLTPFSLCARRDFVSSLPESEGEWVPPPTDLTMLGLQGGFSGMEVDSDGSDSDPGGTAEDQKALRAAADTSRPRGEGTRWRGRMR